MKKSIYMLALSLLTVGATQSCSMFNSDKEKAQEEATKAESDLEEAAVNEVEAQKELEWVTFKRDAEIRVEENDVKIKELRTKLTKPGKVLDAMYAKRIETLEQQNANLLVKMANYEANKGDWEQFEAEFQRDLDALGKSINDFGNSK